MCGRLRLEGKSYWISIGIQGQDIIPAAALEHNPYDCENFQWGGYARTDGNAANGRSLPQQWPEDSWSVTLIKATNFSERNRETNTWHQFSVNSKRIGVLVSKDGSLKILTRPSRSQIEKDVHNRMPSIAPAGTTREQYVRSLNDYTGGKYK